MRGIFPVAPCPEEATPRETPLMSASAENTVTVAGMPLANALPAALAREIIRKVAVVILDAAAVFLALVLSFGFWASVWGLSFEFPRHVRNLFLFLPILVFTTYFLEGYKPLERRRPERELEILVKSVSFSFLFLIAANYVLFKTEPVSRYIVLTWWLASLVLVFAERFTLRQIYHRLWRKGLLRQRVLVIGSGPKSRLLQTLLRLQRHPGFCFVGLASDDAEETSANQTNGCSNHTPLPRLGAVHDWLRLVQEHKVDLVILAFRDFSDEVHRQIVSILGKCKEHRVRAKVFSDVFNYSNAGFEIDEFSGFFVLNHSRLPRERIFDLAFKRGLDVAGGLVGTILAGLLYLIVGAMIKIEDGGPILYKQEFVGQGGSSKHYWKFRTMKLDADKIFQDDPRLQEEFEKSFKLRSDPRVTRVGKFLRKYSLDEFPEFVNVLKGDLSLVGPRTICRREIERYGESFDRLMRVKPGMTGFWQVMGRQTTSYEERVQMDMFYIERWSIWLDAILILKTVWKVVQAEGAY